MIEQHNCFDAHVGIWDTGNFAYPEPPPFHPSTHYPEYPFNKEETHEGNYVYEGIRQLFVLLGLDLMHYGTPKWNPLGSMIRPGDNVVLKPNLVISDHPDGIAGIQASVVHGSLLRAFIDYTLIANGGQGRITIADSPIKEVNFNRILELTGIGPTVAYLSQRHKLAIEVIDFRDIEVTRDENRLMVAGRRLAGDPSGYLVIDLRKHSMLGEIDQHAMRYRSTAAFYENTTVQAHSKNHHLYSIPQRILQADVLISLAKLKTHRKAGVTLSLKNMVGITNEKRWLPHHRLGSPKQGGDQYPNSDRGDIKLRERMKDILITHSWGRWGARYLGIPLFKFYRQMIEPTLDRLYGPNGTCQIEDGDWYGNDTVWRMVLDLNTLLFYADREGRVQESPQRRYFSMIDGIIGGMEEGPLRPKPIKTGILIAGFNPVAVDLVSTRAMGFDFQRIPLISRAMERAWLPLGMFQPEDLQISSNLDRWRQIWQSRDTGLDFQPSKGWQGHVELKAER